MRSLFCVILAVFFFASCQETKKQQEKTDQEEIHSSEQIETDKSQGEAFRAPKFHFATELPQGYKVYQGMLPAESPVVNIYAPAENHQPPFAIHEQPELSYIAFMPKGFGVDAPSGERMSLREWKGSLPVSASVDPDRSVVYLLKNGQVRAAIIRFYSPPPGWESHGLIYVHYRVRQFQGRCIDSDSGKEIPMEKCDPMGGDQVEFSGNVSGESRENLNSVLEHLYFYSGNDARKGISDLIRVEQPEAESPIQSPLIIRGEARGSWFFEAEAPVRLVNEEGREMARGSVKAQGEWMTADFVPFEGRLEFQKPRSGKGYLVLERSNASGKPEHDRSWRVPVYFE